MSSTNSSQGWLWALALGSSGLLYTLFHHQTFWLGMHEGFVMRQQVIAAVYDKVLRLNSASIADVTVGKVGCRSQRLWCTWCIMYMLTTRRGHRWSTS